MTEEELTYRIMWRLYRYLFIMSLSVIVSTSISMWILRKLGWLEE